jgi:hypothetical protein
MKTSMPSLLLRSRLILVGVAIGSTPGLANESKFAFTMEHRYVNGSENGISHSMDRGTLTVSGELRTVSCGTTMFGRKGVPELVRINVMEEGSLVDAPAICSFAVSPSVTVDGKVPFNVTCNNIRKAKFYLIAYQLQDDDGCAVEATGALTTK